MRYFFPLLAYLALPLLTLYSCFSAIYLFDIRSLEFYRYLILWIPGIFLYYIFIGQLIIGQRLPFLDRIWGFPNIVRKHRGLLRNMFLLTLLLHSGVHLYKDGIDKVLLHPDIGMIVIYIVVAASIILMFIAAKVWLKPQPHKRKVANYGRMHRIHQLFYLLAVGVWYHVVTAGAFEDNFLGTFLVTGYLLFALLCKLYMLIAQYLAPIYQLQSVEVLHENFIRLKLSPPKVYSRAGCKRIRTLQDHAAGQYAYLSFEVLKSNQKSYWEQHPFSLSSYTAGKEDDSALTVIVKKLGDFTAKLPELQGNRVKVLGPYGQFQCPSDLPSAQLIAAGIGITPFLSMLEQRAFLAEQGNLVTDKVGEQKWVLHWFVREPNELIFTEQFHYFLEKIPGLQIQTYVGDLISEDLLHEILAVGGPRESGILYCGPSAVIPKIQKVIATLKIPKKNFHTELFSM